MSSYGLVTSSEELSRRQSDVAWLRRASTRLADNRENGTLHDDIPVAVSENTAVTATFLRLLRNTPLDVVFDQPLAERLEAQLREMLSVLADEPRRPGSLHGWANDHRAGSQHLIADYSSSDGRHLG